MEAVPTPPTRRADQILTAIIACICVLVLGLIVVLRLAAGVYERNDSARDLIRSTRNGAIALTQEHADASAALRSYLLNRDPRLAAQYQQERAEVQQDLELLHRLDDHDPELAPLVAHIDALAERDFAALDAGLAGRQRSASNGPANELREAIERLHSTVLRRAERIRADEEATRGRLDSIAVALAVLSLLASALAILALRRERGQWQKATEALTIAHAKAAASDIAKTRFLAAASHDMRQPLHALTLYISALQRRVDSDEAREILAKMERAAHSMSGMFSTLLDLARIQADVVEPEIETFPLQDVIDRVVSQHPGAPVTVKSTPVEVRTDPLLLERLLRNLLSNALKHGGGAAQIEMRQVGRMVEVAVIDQGPGIKSEDQERIFDEFTRLDGRAGGEGLGLGLAIVKRIADLLSLDLDLRSAPGKGSSFIVRIPVTAVSAEAPARQVVRQHELDGLRVVVMDDDPLALEAAAGALRDLRADVRTAAREADVTAILDSGFTPDLMVMDLRIDGALAGVDIANRARARLERKPQVIVVTGDTAPEALAALRASGHRWLTKPVNPNDLMEAVETAAAQ